MISFYSILIKVSILGYKKLILATSTAGDVGQSASKRTLLSFLSLDTYFLLSKVC